MSSSAVIAGIDIGGTSTAVVLCTPQLDIIARSSAPTPASIGGVAMMDTCTDLISKLLEAKDVSLLGIGVGAAGVIETRSGTVLIASNSFTDWAGFPVASTLRDRFDVPAFVDNDVNAFLRGEVATGAVAGETHALGIMLGTGVGGALWLNGSLIEGLHGAAGEIGHSPGFGDLPCTCGQSGHLETLASGRSIAARYHDRTGIALPAAEIARLADSGDPAASAVFVAAGAGIGRAIIMVAALIDVTTVVIGGGVTRAWHLLEPAIRDHLAAEPPISGRPIRLERSILGDDAVALGAASRVRQEVADGYGISSERGAPS